ncbi:MAG: SPOR domain-containing protein [Thermoanaerobaculales bacterium]|jgi:cell division septation protein DedD|nr:SPOR domain-containing protein [Thermoanaerobaculales bacterium]
MSRSYYVIELSARWLTVLLVALALLMVLAFGLGYGAAWSVKDEGPAAGAAGPAPTPLVQEEVILEPGGRDDQPPAPTRPAATPTPRPMPSTPAPATPRPTVVVPREEPTRVPTPKPLQEKVEGFWVQVLASSKEASIADARAKLGGQGFDAEHQKVVRTEVAGGAILYKLRVGPLPDRASADRVLQRMRSAGFPDAWVVAPN